MRKLTDEEFKTSMEDAIKRTSEIDAQAVKAMKKIMEQREEILEAFVAKYGFEPEEAVQVEFKTPNGSNGWMVRKTVKEDPTI